MKGRTGFFMLVGALLGAGWLEADGLLPGLLLGWFVGDYLAVRERVGILERRLGRGAAPPQAAPPPRPAALEEETVSPPQRPASPPDLAVTAHSMEESPVPEGMEAATPQSETSVSRIHRTPPAPGIAARLLTLVSGGNPLVRVGILLLFFGVTFLFKYVSQTLYVPLEARFIGTALLGLSLLAVGWRLHQPRPGYAQVLQGGGIGVLYLTIFVATRFDLVPTALAFPLLVGVAVLAALLALGQNAQALALFGAVGGYLAPLLVARGGGNHVQLFAYYVILNGGVLGLAWFKSWRSLNLAGFLFTFTIGVLWGQRFYRPAYLANTEPFLVLFFLMYVTVSVLFALRQPPRLRGLVDGTLVFGLPIAAFALQARLVQEIEFGLAWSAAALSAFYLILTSLLWRHQRGLRLLCESFLALGVVFATLAVPLAVDGRWTATTWALEGAALVWIGVRQQGVLARISGLGLQFLAGFAFSRGWSLAVGPLPVLNGHCLGGVLIALAGLFSSWYLQRHLQILRPWERGLHWLFLVWGLLWWYGTGVHEIDRFVPATDQLNALLLWYAGSAALAVALRPPLHWLQLGLPTLLLLPVAALLLINVGTGLAYLKWTPLTTPLLGLGGTAPFYHPFAGNGWLVWPLVFVVQYWGLYQLDSDFPNPILRRLWHAATLWLLAWILTWELARLFDTVAQGEGAWALAIWGALPAGLVLWLVQRGPLLLPWPLARYRTDYLTWGGAPLLMFIWGWSLYANWVSDGSAAPLPHLPLLNPLDVAVLCAVLAFLSWWVRLRVEQSALRARHRRQATFMFASGVFIWLTAFVGRSVHQWAGVPFSWGLLIRSTTFQSAVSLVWSGVALVLMAWAARRTLRSWWMAGAALLGLVVGKLFLVELAHSGTLARIVSFLGVGLLLLVIGYLAPLPPRMKED